MPNPFIGFLASALFCIAAGGFGLWLLQKWRSHLDPCAQLGISGLVGIATLGTGTLLIGLLPSGLNWGRVPMALCTVFGLYQLTQNRSLFKGTTGPKGGNLFWGLLVVFGGLFSLVGVLTPSVGTDWDSIAYHMAVPKIYALTGSIHRIVYIHHSNFPSAIELLFTWGILPFGQAWAKTILWTGSLYGVLAIYGLVKRKFGPNPAWIAAAAFYTVPTVIWESGTAYIDVVHGLFGGLAALLLFSTLTDSEYNRSNTILAGILMGFACGTKYTGLVTVVLALIIYGVTSLVLKRKNWPKACAMVAIISAGVGGCWYIKNIVLQGNPVYPFAYETFGGKNWNEERAQIYRQEQLAFGVGVSDKGKDWSELGHAIFGLAYQPGRYVNPMETQGGGYPNGAIGLGLFAGLLYWCFIRKPGRQVAGLLGFAGITFLMWFGLSQQSRYLTDLLPIGAFLVADAVDSGGLGIFIAGILGLQGLYSLAIEKFTVVDPGLPVMLGKESPSAYLETSLPFYQVAEDINAMPDHPKVALYDQVFGYYLDTPYFWANPPHCTVIPYPSMKNGLDYVNGLKAQGISLIYVQFVDPSHDRDFADALGINGSPHELSPALNGQWSNDWVQQWKPLMVDAAVHQEITPVKFYRFGALFQIQASH